MKRYHPLEFILIFGISVFLSVSSAWSTEPSCETPLAGDYDGDRKCDPATYLRSQGSWLIRLSGQSYIPASMTFGAAAFTPVVGDFDGDGKTDPTLYQDATGSWLINQSSLDYTTATALLGGTGWTAVPADFDGDGKTDPAAYEPATGIWLASLSGSEYTPVTFPSSLGGPTYIPVPADFDGDRLADPAIFGNGIWGVMLSGQGYALAMLSAGMTGGVPFAVDFDGDGKVDPTLFQNATALWTVKLSSLGYATATTVLGAPGTIPIAGDFDGDGLADPAAYLESTRTLTVRLSSLQYGQASLVMGTPPAKRVMVLYDTAGSEGWRGRLVVQFMQNLVSHFDLPCQSKPVEQYQTGDMAPYTATFYIGSVYDNPLPAAFQTDAMTGNYNLCWMGFNLWQLAWTPNADPNPLFYNKFGFNFIGLETGFSEVRYSGKRLPLYDIEDTLGAVEIVNSNIVAVLAGAYRGPTNEGIPYILCASNLWYVANNPLQVNYMGDGSLAFADLLHDMLGIQHAVNHRAIIRIEDVNAETPAATLQAIAECLHERQIPFIVSLIPLYLDPLGVVHQGFSTRLELSDNPDLLRVLRNIGSLGGQIIQHGYTHQYDSIPNPIGATAADYEFYRVVEVNGINIMLGPLIEDSPQWAGERVAAGKSILVNYGLNPLAWLTPHYYASETDYGVFPLLYPLALDRGEYFTLDNDGRPQDAEQVPPFLINRDVFGQKRLPETIGYISPGYGLLPSNLVANAEANLVVRDGWAGCYYHWFFGTNYLPELITGITNLGYRFVPIDPNME